MSDMKQFDDFFKQSFSDYTPDVPPHIWENIAAGKKKKKAVFFWLTGKKTLVTIAALLLVGVGAFIVLNQKNNVQSITHENNGSRQETGKTVPAAVLEDKTGKDIVPANDNTNNAIVKNKERLPSETGIVPAAGTAATLKTIPAKDAAGNTYNKTGNAATGQNDLSYANNIPGNRLHSKGRAVKEKIAAQKTVPANFANTDQDNDGSDADIAAADMSGDGVNIRYVEGARDKILLLKENLLSKQTIQPTPTKLFEDCPGSTSGNNYYIEAYFSPDYAIKKYSDTGNSSLVQKRKESLHFQSAYSAGLRYTRVFSNGMSIRAGFNYSQIKEKFSYAQDNVVQIVYVINTAGDTTDSYYVRGTRFRNSYNHYRTIDVPVVVGYEMGNGNFHANINAGVVVNLYSWQKVKRLIIMALL